MQDFINLIQSRSDEHEVAFSRLHDLPGSMMSILRQELDSLIRVLYLLSLTDLAERNRLMSCTLSGERWKYTTTKGKQATVTDAVMVDVSQKLEGWSKSVYKFGCAFIHLSNFHGYMSSNPLDSISAEDKADILEHMRCYHHGPESDNPTFSEFSQYFPRVFSKIKGNLECYLEALNEKESGENGL